MTYEPKSGKQTENFLSGIDIPAPQKNILIEESLNVIKAAGSSAPGRQNVGLVVGYVQSGKTMSLTCVSSLARDNGYGHIVILCGVTKELFEQNMKRVEDDLIAPSRKSFLAKENPKRTEADFYRGKFQLWKSSKGKNATVVTFLLKHSSNINNLANLLSNVGKDAEDVPTLVIDDEAHMAGLNTSFTKKEESDVYKALKNLRYRIPDYAYLQYTATPQAPLLVHVADCVSPEFAIVLTPGDGYIGGRQFFPEKSNKELVIDIPENELPESKNPALPESPPDSLKQALHLFLVGVADNLSKEQLDCERSMLIHPHKETKWHWRYSELTKDYLNFAYETLKGEDEGEKEMLLNDFSKAYKELKRTCKELSNYDAIVSSLPDAIVHAKSGIIVVNSTNKERIQWAVANILIGGEILGVGFTVKGLTISYMLRTSPKGQIDSMQQRARFFGYRGKDLGLTRVFLSAETHAAFRDYVKHEEGTREELKKMQEAGKSLKQWRRNFLIRAGMQLTRSSIQSLVTLRSDASKTTHPLQPYYKHEQHNPEHLKLLKEITEKWGLEKDPETKKNWTEAQTHLSGYIDAEKVLDDVIARFNWVNEDDIARWDSNFYLLRFMAEEAKREGKKAKYKVMVMRPSERGTGERGVTTGAWELLQGRNPAGGYPGDKAMADPDVTTIQLHCYTFKHGRTGEVMGKDIVVPIILPAKSDQRTMQAIMQVK